MAIRVLRFTKYVENIFCIYRNYCLFEDFPRKLILLRIIAELLLILFHCVIRTYYYMTNHSQNGDDILYFYLSSSHSIVIIVFGCYSSKKYKYFIKHLESGFKYINKNSNLKKIRTKDIVVVGFIFLFGFVECFAFSSTQFTSAPSIGLSEFWHIFFQINLLACDIRYIIELFVLYYVLRIMSVQLKFITNSIDKSNHFVYNDDELIAEVDKWSVTYNHIRESSKCFNNIFGVQVSTSLKHQNTIFFLYLKIFNNLLQMKSVLTINILLYIFYI